MTQPEITLDVDYLLNILDSHALNSAIPEVEVLEAMSIVEGLFLLNFPDYEENQEIPKNEYKKVVVETSRGSHMLFTLVDEAMEIIKTKKGIATNFKWINYARSNQS